MSADVFKVLGGAIAVVLVIAFGDWIGLWNASMGSESDDKPAPLAAPTPDSTFLGKGERSPREFLYLDNARSEAFLSQIQGGLETLRKIAKNTSGELGGELALGPVKLSGKGSREDADERSVTPTASSNFQALKRHLEDLELLKFLDESATAASTDEQPQAATSGCAPGVRPQGDTMFAAKWCSVQEGDAVTFVARVHQPRFVRIFLRLRRAGARSWLGRHGASVMAVIGKDPRVPLIANVDLGSADASSRRASLRVVIPVQSALLSPEPSLFSPSLRVVGKVIRRVDDEGYRDVDFYVRFRPMLGRRFAAVRKRLGVSRKELRKELAGHRTVQAPAAVVLPIAVFK